MREDPHEVVEEDKPEKDRKVASDYKYDSTCRSWRGPITGAQQTQPVSVN